jgi:DNA-directed RNA polymerase specialized sigma24 family protein
MKSNPGTLQEGGAVFQTTHWTVVKQAMVSQPAASAEHALGAFCQAYWPPLYTFVRRRGRSPSDAQDLVQGFFAHLLSQRTLSRANREKGRLRTFLLGSFQHFLANEYDRVQTLKRGGGQRVVSLDDDGGAAAEAALVSGSEFGDTAAYDQSWVATLVSRAWEQLQREYTALGKSHILKELKPFLTGGAFIPDQEEVAARLQIPFATLRTILRRLRQRYREILRQEVARTVGDPRQVDDELRYLHELMLAS